MRNKIIGYFIGLAVFLGVAYAGIQWFVDDQVGEGLDQAVAQVDGLSVAYSDLGVSLPARTVELDNVVLTWRGDSVSADKVLIERFDQRNPVPQFLRASVRGLVLDRGRVDGFGLGALMDTLGVDSLRLDMDLDYVYDPATKTLTVDRLKAASSDGGDLDMAVTLTNIDPEDTRLEQLVGVNLKSLRLRVEDRSMVESWLTNMGERAGRDAAWARGELDRSLAASARRMRAEGTPESAETLDNLREFLREPGTMVLTAAPKEPMPLAFLFMGRKLGENLRLLGVTVDLNPTAQPQP